MYTVPTQGTPPNIPHLSYDDCPENKRESYQNCSVLCTTVVHNDMHAHTWAVLTSECRFWFSSRDLGLAFCSFFRFNLDYFVTVLFAFVVMGFVSSVLCQQTG